MLWRGVVEHPPILTGRSMVVVGGMRKARLALYPIALQTATPGTSLLNWAVAARLGAGAGRPPRREDWNRLGRPDELVPQIDGAFELSVIDPVEIVRTTREFFEFPMCDRDPVPRWSFGG
jgi:5-methylphenazine-1-carboxylate 1-monooxygenase